MPATAADARPDLRVCTVCGAVCDRFGPGPGGHRQDACCRACGALERHRFLVLVAAGLTAATKGEGILLDVAPMSATAPLLKTSALAGYLAMDFDPKADNRIVDVVASLTDAPVPDSSVALLVCMHVLEHIPDDAAAMREIARVLSSAGIAVIQVPHRSGVPTDEDPSAGPAERLRRFGQADHVRYYGDDFEDRLRAAGLTVTVITPGDVVEPRVMGLLGLLPDETFWLCTRPEGGPADPAATLRAALPDAFAAVLTRSAATTLRERARLTSSGGASPAKPAAAPPNRLAPTSMKRVRQSNAYRVVRRSLPGRAAAKAARSLRR